MKKMLLKSLVAFIVACMLVLTFGGFVANEVTQDEGFTEIIICDEIDSDKAQQIIALLNGDDLMSPISVFCIFGHSLAETRAITIEHRFWSTSPRCRETVHRVVYCTRSSCNHMVLTQLSQRRILCCS
jgi:hypothetical protein